jgi:hypothetical protein
LVRLPKTSRKESSQKKAAFPRSTLVIMETIQDEEKIEIFKILITEVSKA